MIIRWYFALVLCTAMLSVAWCSLAEAKHHKGHHHAHKLTKAQVNALWHDYQVWYWTTDLQARTYGCPSVPLQLRP